MLQRLIAALLGVLGVAAAALGVASATAWRADDPLVAGVTADGSGTLVTDPGVLELAGDPVTVTVSAGDDPVVLAVGRDTDVDAWIGTDPYSRVTGLSDWHTLAVVAGEPPTGVEPTADPTAAAEPTAPAEAVPSADATEGAADPAGTQTADPTGSDLWVVETAGDRTASLRWDAQPGRWSLIAVSLGSTAPTLELSWPQTVTTPWLWPGVALGVLLVAVSAVLWVRIWRRSRLGPDADWHDVSTGMIAAVAPAAAGPSAPAARVIGAVSLPPTTSHGTSGTPATSGATVSGTGTVPVGTVSAPTSGQPLTRRQIREAEAAAAAARGRGRRPATGALPVVTGVIPAVPSEADSSTPVRGVPRVTARPVPPAVADTGGSTGAIPVPPTSGPAAGTGTAPSAPVSAAGVPSTGTGPSRPAGTSETGAIPPRATSTTATSTSSTSTDASTPAHAPSGAPAGGASDEPAEPGRRRGLGSLFGRRGRGGAEPLAAASADPAPSSPAPTAPGDDPVPRAATSWTPIPGQSARPAAAPSDPSATGAPGSGPMNPVTADEDGAARAQRADAWRRMWGFTPEAGAPPADDAPPSTSTDRPTEEDR